MDEGIIEGVVITPLSIIETKGGDVFHALKSNDVGYVDFGEAYFSNIDKGIIKAWKRHHTMVLNIVVPIGSIKFVMYDDRDNSDTKGNFQTIVLSKLNYARVTVPPMIWLGFQGGEDTNMLLNIASIHHEPNEVDRLDIDMLKYDWK